MYLSGPSALLLWKDESASLISSKGKGVLRWVDWELSIGCQLRFSMTEGGLLLLEE